MAAITRSKALAIGPIALGCAAVAGLALANHLVARRTERRHPPQGRFVTVDGVRLHYTDRGAGSPVVLIHGNAVSGQDWDTSGVAEALLERHRVIAFDRPGCGHSARPRGRVWTADQQGELIFKALRQLGVERPVVAGHSWGTIVALAMAARHQADIAGLVLVSGYYFWTVRPDVPLVAVAALPGLGDLLRHTVSPLLGWLQMPLLKWQMFSPARVPRRFQDEYSTGMALRPSQIRATAEDGTLMLQGALALQEHYKDLALPTVIIAGDGDKVVFPRMARRLADALPGSVLQVVTGAGHMVHHFAARQVAQAVADMAGRGAAAGGVTAPVTAPSHGNPASAVP